MTFVADDTAPPVQANTSGLKVLFSTLIIRDTYLSLCVSRNLYASLISFRHDLASGFKIFTLKKVRQKRESGSIDLFSSLVSFSVDVVLRKNSPSNS